MHLDHVTGAIEQGHAVLCDKPFGRNADEATEMRDRACEAGVLHFLNFEFRRNEVVGEGQTAGPRRKYRHTRDI